MQTRYLTSLTIHFNPLSPARAHRIPRLLIARLPAAPIASNGSPLPVKSRILSRHTVEPAKIIVGFKGGETLEFVEATRREKRMKGEKKEVEENPVLADGLLDLGRMGLMDVLEEVGRKCRVLGRKDQIAG